MYCTTCHQDSRQCQKSSLPGCPYDKPEPHYRVIDTHTGQVAATYKTRKLAARKADKLDLEYGAVRYSVQYQ